MARLLTVRHRLAELSEVAGANPAVAVETILSGYSLVVKCGAWTLETSVQFTLPRPKFPVLVYVISQLKAVT